jgi:hypothetical protein
MRMKNQVLRDITEVRRVFSGAAVTAASLYLTTHSTAVTVAVTVVAAGLNGWAMWLAQRCDGQLLSHGPREPHRPGDSDD